MPVAEVGTKAVILASFPWLLISGSFPNVRKHLQGCPDKLISNRFREKTNAPSALSENDELTHSSSSPQAAELQTGTEATAPAVLRSVLQRRFTARNDGEHPSPSTRRPDAEHRFEEKSQGGTEMLRTSRGIGRRLRGRPDSVWDSKGSRARRRKSPALSAKAGRRLHRLLSFVK